MAETKAELGYNYRGMFGSIETCRDDPKELTDDGNFYLCIPVAEAREFLGNCVGCSQAAIGLWTEAQETNDKARALLAILPEEE